MDKTVIIRKIVIALMIVLIIAYIISVVLKSNFTQIKTETANIMTVSDSISVNGYFIRDEQLITYKDGGFISYTLSDGDKVSKNEAIANVFSSESAAADKQTIDNLEAQIDRLQQLNKTAETLTATPDELDKNIDTLLSQINLNISDGDFSKANNNVENLLYNINERHLVTGKVARFSEKIKELQSQVSSLKKNSAESQKSKSILSPATGYFVGTADGYENIYTSADLDDLMPGDLSEDKISQKPVDDDVVGKVMEGVYWYIACEVSADDALRIKNSDSLSVEIPLVNNRNISVEVYAINQKTKTSDALVILQGNYMNEEMAGIRNENIAVVLNVYTGIYVSKNAVHECTITETETDESGNTKEVTKTVPGVYIRISNELLFKQIIPLYTGNDFVICKQSPDDEELYTDEIGILKAYDEVVVEGANLYDGKIIDRTN
ncbi:MAG: hypothetical protein IJ861_02085 [Clostridia bacterium]|nr:hypothetical protein [Clostridia bacterium]